MRPLVTAALAFSAFSLAALSIPSALQAQTAPPGSPGYAAGESRPAEGRSGDWRVRGRAMMARREQERAASLHTILNIQPGQEAAFAAFQQSMQWTPKARGEGSDERRPMTTPQRLDKALAHLEERTGRMRRRIEATRAFYAALNPSQQKVFDALGELRGGHGEGRGGGMHGPDGPRGMGPGGMPPGGPGADEE